ncbi:protein FAM227B-like isoform X2 [Callorhinchus milii]|uniref:protein FAM227B-like isoform X2 n=1 Tax=Callorhinchus milii TaxID=7868 RepID=UPI0004572277|nr:protein FAM227B-like isoform X2 [Callorhinchus milii]|eukprot:gi/632938294/ref/XP_007904468.1/ PREDICTED: protein FAM227B-like isoform X2 [Callorhinchus milii]
MGTPRKIQDKFFLEYHDFLAQAIFAVFYKSFPESHEQFGAEFKTELTELISLWLTGLKPPHLSWKKWNLEWLVNLTIGAKKDDYDEKEEVMNMLEARAGKMNLQFNFDKLLKGVDEGIVKETEIPTPKLMPTVEVKQSCYVGRGPEFQYVLYRLKGRSPLVNHYLQMKNIGTGKVASWGGLMKRSEISKFPPLHPTFQDVIKENEKFRDDLHQDYSTLREQTKKEMKKIKMDTIKIGHRISRTI